MSANKAATLNLQIFGDGIATVFAIDLLKDPYSVSTGTGELFNWFARDKYVSEPIGVLTFDGAVNAIMLSGNTVTITFITAPSGYAQTSFILKF